VQPNECLGHRRAQVGVHREPLAGPVGRSPERPELRGDEPALLLLVGPHPAQKLVPAHLLAGGPLAPQQLLDLQLRGNPRVVRPRQPQHRPAPHPVEARQHVLEGREDGVAHVQPSRHVGRGHGEHVRLLFGGRFFSSSPSFLRGSFGVRQEALRRLPPLVNVGFEGRRIVRHSQPSRLVDEIVPVMLGFDVAVRGQFGGCSCRC
jgi:hypothetical protein